MSKCYLIKILEQGTCPKREGLDVGISSERPEDVFRKTREVLRIYSLNNVQKPQVHICSCSSSLCPIYTDLIGLVPSPYFLKYPNVQAAKSACVGIVKLCIRIQKLLSPDTVSSLPLKPAVATTRTLLMMELIKIHGYDISSLGHRNSRDSTTQTPMQCVGVEIKKGCLRKTVCKRR